MGYQQRARSSRSSGRGHDGERRAKSRSRAREKKHQLVGLFASDQEVPTLEVSVGRTLGMLHNLGNQVFAVSPFSVHFDRWLTDLRVVLTEFESSPNVTVDDQFVEERSRILLNVEADLEERRRKEAAGERAFKDLSDGRLRLERIEQDHAVKEREIRRRKDGGVSRLSGNVDALQEELARISRMKTGIFRGLSKKAKAQKEAEAARKLSSAKNELTLALKGFAVEEEKLRGEHEAKKRFVTEEIRNEQREVDIQETDGSMEARQAACKALAESVDALSKRQLSSPR